jgi:hypothetical protein
MLTSRQPIWIGWGAKLIYLGPTSVVWREIWQDIGPMLSQAMGGTEGT